MNTSWIVFVGTGLAVLLIIIGVAIWAWAVRKNTSSGVAALAGPPQPWEKIWEEISAALTTIREGLTDVQKRIFALGTLLVMVGLFIMIAWSMPILVADKASGGGDDPKPSASASASPSPTPTKS